VITFLAQIYVYFRYCFNDYKENNCLNGSRISSSILAAGLVAFPGSIQEAQANPCSVNEEGDGADTVTTGDQECDLTGYFEFDE
jgi:hypothetical protein